MSTPPRETIADTLAPGSTAAKSSSSLSGSGVLYALSAYVFWGFVPIYWKQLAVLPATEVLVYRIFGSFLISLLLLAGSGTLPEVMSTLRKRRQLVILIASGICIGCNWWIFIWAVNDGRILETSLGYFLTPLLNIASGIVMFGERFSRPQTTAVGLATVGVAYMAVDFGQLPWVSLALAFSFSMYGVLRKTSAVSSLGGLLVESTVLSLLALLYLALGGQAFGIAESNVRLSELPTHTLWLLAGSGVITAVPLVCFAAATKRLPMSAVGVFQYVAPSLSLGVAIVLYGEVFTLTHAITFTLIWSALALYSWDTFRVRSRVA